LLTHSNICAFILSKLQIVLINFPRVGAAVYTKTTPDFTYGELYDMRDAWKVVRQFRPLDSRGLNDSLLRTSYHVIQGGAFSVLIASDQPSISFN
jgi:hypothetical protein